MRTSNSFINPEYFETGSIARQTSVNDEYFVKDGEPAVRAVLDEFVSMLPEWKRSAVQMCIMANMTYQEASEKIEELRGKPTHKKTVWRWAQEGVEEMRRWLMLAPWVGPMTNNKIPVDMLDENEPVYVPWENDGQL
jgi:hypothetical protein